MEKPKITPWNQDKINEEEEFIVFKPCRIAVAGKPARAFKKNESVSLKGGVKKDLYFQNKILYPKDFEAVVKYETEQKEKFQREATKQEAEKSLNEKGKGK
jgi:hypothetical protein